MNAKTTTNIQAITNLTDALNYYISYLTEKTGEAVPAQYIDLISPYLSFRIFEKRDFYCRQNEATDKTGLLITGLAKAYRVNEEGESTIIKFFMQNDWISAENAQIRLTSDRTIEFASRSSVLTINNLPPLYKSIIDSNSYPALANFIINIYQLELERSQQISHIRTIVDAKERIREYYKHFPDYDAHFNGTDIASYIGIKRETFSRLRSAIR